MKDVLQLAATIVMASSVKTKVWLQKFKNNESEVFKWQFYIFETDDEARNLFMKRQDM